LGAGLRTTHTLANGVFFLSYLIFQASNLSVLLGFSVFSWFSRDSAIPLIHSKVSGTCLGLITHVVQNRKVCRTFSTSVSTCLPIAYNPIIGNSSIARRDKLNKKEGSDHQRHCKSCEWNMQKIMNTSKQGLQTDASR
jgi:hypothetical protein